MQRYDTLKLHRYFRWLSSPIDVPSATGLYFHIVNDFSNELECLDFDLKRVFGFAQLLY